MSDWINPATSYLTLEQMAHNVNLLLPYFRNDGWTDNAIAGMLGNMQTESKINPGLWQGRSIPSDWSTTSKGYGFTQWTPAHKLIDWCIETYPGQDWTGNGDMQCNRIIYERHNNLQWSMNNYGNHTWDQFATSTETPEILARVFLWAYERPAAPVLEQRQTQARYWYDYITGVEPSPIPIPFDELPLAVLLKKSAMKGVKKHVYW